MVKKVIQVPIGEELLSALNHTSKKQNRARAEVIREACESYVARVESEELDRLYQQGYEKVPEGPEVGEVQIDLVAEILPEESW